MENVSAFGFDFIDDPVEAEIQDMTTTMMLADLQKIVRKFYLIKDVVDNEHNTTNDGILCMLKVAEIVYS